MAARLKGSQSGMMTATMPNIRQDVGNSDKPSVSCQLRGPGTMGTTSEEKSSKYGKSLVAPSRKPIS